MATKDDLHKLIEQLPEDEIQAATLYLQHLHDRQAPVLAALLNAPEDDEPETEWERQAVNEALADLEAGRMATSGEILHDISGLECRMDTPRASRFETN